MISSLHTAHKKDADKKNLGVSAVCEVTLYALHPKNILKDAYPNPEHGVKVKVIVIAEGSARSGARMRRLLCFDMMRREVSRIHLSAGRTASTSRC